MLKRPKILVAGSFNMDLTASCTRAPGSGETVIGKKFRTAPGGKGFNQAVQCARLGADVTMVGKVGADDFGKALLEAAKGEDIDIYSGGDGWRNTEPHSGLPGSQLYNLCAGDRMAAWIDQRL